MKTIKDALAFAKTLEVKVIGKRIYFDGASYLKSPEFRHFLLENKIQHREFLKGGKLVYELKEIAANFN